MKLHRILLSTCVALAATSVVISAPRIVGTGDKVVLSNAGVRLEFDLAGGTYAIFDQDSSRPAIANASLQINQWSSNAENVTRSWQSREVDDHLGKGLALDLTIQPADAPRLFFSYTLYGDEPFICASGGIENTGAEAIQLNGLHVMFDAEVYPDDEMSEGFAMIDGFSGGEPLEYGERSYSPLTRANALKSRNNIYLTFSDPSRGRRQLVMGGLSYHDFEKFATIAQARETELAIGPDGVSSLLCYLDLPVDDSYQSPTGETLTFVRSGMPRVWENHEFRCTEMATSAMNKDGVVIECGRLIPGRPYTLGFSWWQGHRHGDHPDLTQSVYAEFDTPDGPGRIALIENAVLPRFDGIRKEDVEQVELSLPAEAIAAGELRIVVEKSSGTDDEPKEVYLSEVWLRDGRYRPLLPAELTPVASSPRSRRQFSGHLYAYDPVGKRVDPGQRYLPGDRFYIDVTGDDPFLALEAYAQRVKQAQQVELSMYDFPTVCLWYAADKRYGGIGKEGADNTSLGAVEEARDIAASGFLKYSRAAVRLVPDSYMPNNHQGWWDDEHWQREDTDRDTTQNGRYVEPYETTEKWGQAVTELGSIPLTYFQTSYRSEDYAARFPGHMLFNKQYAWKGDPVDLDDEMFRSWEKTWTRNGKVLWGYDFTDPDFVDHLENVYANLKKGGIKGLMFDYPASGWARAGGMEDVYSTTAAAYRTIFRLPHELLGPESYVHERNMERGTDVTLGVVASMRTENDTDSLDAATVTRCGLRWYKNRVLVNFDTDSKNLLELEDNRDHLRAVLTMCYVTSGRLLLANSFAQFSSETFRDLTRTFPYHTENKSARPVDAFVSEVPMVYDYEVDPDWHQVTFYNPDTENEKRIGIDISGPRVDGSLAMDPEHKYWLYDFWNDRLIGKQSGDSRIEQTLRPGEARMIAVRRCQDRPQVLSTDRHLMQGYLDLSEVAWDEESKTLSGVSQVIGGELYKIVLARNGHELIGAETAGAHTEIRFTNRDNRMVEIVLLSQENSTVKWSVTFR